MTECQDGKNVAPPYRYALPDGKAPSLLDAGKNKDVDYKEKVKGLNSEDLVAFINSRKGGAILIGICEVAENHEKRQGEPYPP